MKSIKHLYRKLPSVLLFKEPACLLHQNRQGLPSALGVALGCGPNLLFSVIGRFSRQHHTDRHIEGRKEKCKLGFLALIKTVEISRKGSLPDATQTQC